MLPGPVSDRSSSVVGVLLWGAPAALLSRPIFLLQGKYDFKLLAVDVPTAAGPEQRLYLAGDDRIYQRGSIIAELRDPFLQVRSTPLNAHWLYPDKWRSLQEALHSAPRRICCAAGAGCAEGGQRACGGKGPADWAHLGRLALHGPLMPSISS